MLRDLLKAIGITVLICLLTALVLTLGHNSRSHLGTHPRWHAANSPPNQKSHHKPSLNHHSASYKPTTTPKRISDASRTP
jgi:hypothetical protein